MSQAFTLSDPDQREAGLEAAAREVQRGGLVVFPTDTVYGVAGNAFSPPAVEKLLWAKGRWKELPLAIMVGRTWAIEPLAQELSSSAQRLVEAFWPGALTLLVRIRDGVEWDIGVTVGVVAVRMPNHPVALQLLRETGPLAVTSANRVGAPPATTCEEAEGQLGHRVAVYLDDGPCAGGATSVIVDATGAAPRLVRPGPIDVAALRAVCPALIVDSEAKERDPASG